MDKKTILKISAVVIICLAVGFFAGMEYKAYQVRKVLQEAVKEMPDIFDRPNQQAIPTPEESKEKKQEDYVWIKKNIGDIVEGATIKFKVIRSEEKQIISSKWGTPKVAKEGTKFVVIDIELTNITKEPFNLSNPFILIDDKGRSFNEYEDTVGIDNYLTYPRLSPNIPVRGLYVYEIPKDATSYSLASRKAGTNEVYEVLLK